MALELLASSPGTGKTSYCIELFRNEILKNKGGLDSRSFFVLPSREHADRIQNLILKKGVVGTFNAHILTIDDLTSRLLRASDKSPTEAMRQIIVKRILQKGGSDELRFHAFQEVKDLSGFCHLLVDSIKEFKASLLTVTEFERRCQKLLRQPSFRLKFRDFCLVLKNYEAELEALSLKEPEDNITRLMKNSQELGLMDLVIFDGFYHFTKAQKLWIEFVAKRARRTVVTLTLPQKNKLRKTAFDYPQNTAIFLEKKGFRLKAGFPTNYRTTDPALLHLEKNLFLEAPSVYSAPQTSIRLIEALNIRCEVEAIAREIRRLYRDEKISIHYSDVCILLRRIADSGYEEKLESIFKDMQVPIHIHERKKLIRHGFVATLWRFLNLALEDWKREDLLMVLKSSYFASVVASEDVSSLEMAAWSENILEGKARWSALLAKDIVPESVKRPLRWAMETEAHFLSATTSRQFTEQLRRFIHSFLLDSQALEAIESILRSIQSVHENLNFIKALQESLETALFSVKPSSRNCVQVYDVVMALPKEYKVVFVAGMVEKMFPQDSAEDPLFKDSERRMINAPDEVLDERLPRSGGEEYFFYMAVTRAKERLYLSYPHRRSETQPFLPSFFIEELKKCFVDVPILKESAGSLLPEAAVWETEEEITRGLSQAIFEKKDSLTKHGDPWASLLGVLNQWFGKDYFQEILSLGLEAPGALLQDPKALAIFKQLSGPFSATRLETFATCPFKYFSSKVLRLEEPLEDRESLEMGTLLHQVLEDFYKELPLDQRQDISFWADEIRIKEALEKHLSRVLMTNPFRNQPYYRQRVLFETLHETLTLFASQEKEFFKKRDFIPTYFELPFKEFSLEDPSGAIVINGKIDRVDVQKGQTKALVIDYKLSKRAKTIREKLSKGLELQLPIYLMAVKRLLNLDLIGAELRYLRDAKKEGLYLESAREILGLSKQSILYSREEFEKMLFEAENVIRQSVRRLRQGDISVKSKSCDHCPYPSVCRFEPWKLVYEH